MINLLAQQTATIELLKRDNEERKAREATQKTEDDNTPILGSTRLLLTQGPIGGQQMNGVASNPTGYRGF
jgi:clathrin heavy chain